MIKCHYSQAFSVVERQVNSNNFHDAKIPIDSRAATFEDLAESKSEHIVGNILIDEVTSAVKQICEHIRDNTNTTIQSGTFYFKYDKTDTLVLHFATNIKTDKVELHTNDSI